MSRKSASLLHPFFSAENGGKLHVFLSLCNFMCTCAYLYSEKLVFVCKSTLLQACMFVCGDGGRGEWGSECMVYDLRPYKQYISHISTMGG